MEKLNLTQQSTHSPIKRNILQHKISTNKLKPDLVASYDIRPGNGEGLFLFQRFINLSLTNVLKTLSHLRNYSLGTHTVGVSQNRHKGSNVPSIRSPVVAKERMRPAGDFQWLGSVLLSFLQCKDTAKWHEWHPVSKTCANCLQRFCSVTGGGKCQAIFHLKNGLAAHRLQKNVYATSHTWVNIAVLLSSPQASCIIADSSSGGSGLQSTSRQSWGYNVCMR